MRLPVKPWLPLAAVLAVATSGVALAQATSDYPVLVGDPYTIAGVNFTPSTAMNYDQVGKASVGTTGGAAIAGAHHTLPIPSYVEVTSLESGRTILVRLDQRGPMDKTSLIELSPGAVAQLGLSGAEAPVRVRRVNPPEQERALLRAGQRAAERLPTPPGLLGVLRRKLEQGGFAPVAPMPKVEVMPAPPLPLPKAAPAVTTPAPVKPPVPVATPAPTAPAVAVAPAQAVSPPAAKSPQIPRTAPAASVHGGFVVQIGAFSSKARADSVAAQAKASVSPSGKLWRVRIGPVASRAEADAALARARAAGFKDATLQRAH